MGIQETQFRLHRYTFHDECRHDVLVRVNRPNYPNADQAADEAAQDFADSAADHLRSWGERWLLPRDCRREHESLLVKVFFDVVSAELQGLGLREMTVWEAEFDGEPYIAAAPRRSSGANWKTTADRARYRCPSGRRWPIPSIS
jgi:hypothetical protein